MSFRTVIYIFKAGRFFCLLPLSYAAVEHNLSVWSSYNGQRIPSHQIPLYRNMCLKNILSGYQFVFIEQRAAVQPPYHVHTPSFNIAIGPLYLSNANTWKYLNVIVAEKDIMSFYSINHYPCSLLSSGMTLRGVLLKELCFYWKEICWK